MATHDRWFLTPAVEFTGHGEPATVPKYHDQSGVAGFSGTLIPASEVSTNYPALTQSNPDVDPWYIARFYGENNTGWSALNTIHNKVDTLTLADHANDVAPVFDTHFPGVGRSGEEWANVFEVVLE